MYHDNVFAWIQISQTYKITYKSNKCNRFSSIINSAWAKRSPSLCSAKMCTHHFSRDLVKCSRALANAWLIVCKTE